MTCTMAWMTWMFLLAARTPDVAAPANGVADGPNSEPTENPADFCRTFDLRSRYCRPFRLPPLTFADMERLTRRQRQAFLAGVRRENRRARMTSWLPEITLEWGRVDLQENASNWQPGQDFDTRTNQENRNFWKIRATWDLRGIVRDARDLERARHLQQQMEYMQKQLDRIRRTYYQWFQEVLEHRRNPSLKRLMRCEELEADLNFLTSGAFSVILGPGT